jgi:hypothetical protein
MERTNAEKAALGDVDIIPLRYPGCAYRFGRRGLATRQGSGEKWRFLPDVRRSLGLQNRPASTGSYRQKPRANCKQALILKKNR